MINFIAREGLIQLSFHTKLQVKQLVEMFPMLDADMISSVLEANEVRMWHM